MGRGRGVAHVFLASHPQGGVRCIAPTGSRWQPATAMVSSSVPSNDFVCLSTGRLPDGHKPSQTQRQPAPGSFTACRCCLQTMHKFAGLVSSSCISYSQGFSLQNPGHVLHSPQQT